MIIAVMNQEDRFPEGKKEMRVNVGVWNERTTYQIGEKAQV